MDRKCQPEIRASPQGTPCPSGPSPSPCRCHSFSVKATAQAPSQPPRGQSLVKVPQCLLVHRPSSAHPSAPCPAHPAGLLENPIPALT